MVGYALDYNEYFRSACDSDQTISGQAGWSFIFMAAVVILSLSLSVLLSELVERVGVSSMRNFVYFGLFILSVSGTSCTSVSSLRTE